MKTLMWKVMDIVADFETHNKNFPSDMEIQVSYRSMNGEKEIMVVLEFMDFSIKIWGEKLTLQTLIRNIYIILNGIDKDLTIRNTMLNLEYLGGEEFVQLWFDLNSDITSEMVWSERL